MFLSLKRVVYQVPEMDGAKQWYRKVLGKDPLLDMPWAVHFTVGEAGLTLVPGAREQPTGAATTTAYWEVTDVDHEYRRLIDAGALPHTEVTDVFGVRRGAVVDPFGNVIGLLGRLGGDAQTTVEDAPSGTALVVASLRALAAADERPEIRGRDTLAEIFLTDDRQRMLSQATARAWVIRNAVPAGLYEYLIARTAFFDAVVERALRDQVPQIVFLGAGYDSRPYRFRELVGETRLFEVDAPPTQQRKRALLDKAGIQAPSGLAYVPIDFEKDALEDALGRAGYDPSRTSLFVWEGVIYYLSAAAVDATLAFIRDHSGRPSRVVFDYQGTPAPDGQHRISRELRQGMRATMPSEPVRFRIERGEIGAFLAQRGCRLVEHLDASDMERTFLTLRDGSLAGKVLSHMSIAVATTGADSP